MLGANMAKIFNFPGRSEKEKKGIETICRKELKKFNFANEMEDEIVAAIKKYCNFVDGITDFNPEKNLSFSNEQLKFFADRLHSFTSALVWERFNLEIELYNLRHRDEF